jgi:cell wall-associated NlpC family hydrolase
MGRAAAVLGALTLTAVGMTACQTTDHAGAIRKPVHSAPPVTTQPSIRTVPPVPPRTTTGTTPATVIAAAASQVGVPYCNGGGGINGPSQPTGGGQSCPAPGYDCMSLSQYAVYQVMRITVPTNGEMLPGGTNSDGQGTLIRSQSTIAADETSLEPGDVVFFGGSDLWHYAHSGIYAGGGQVWDALQTGTPVMEHTMTDLYGLYHNFDGAVRY